MINLRIEQKGIKIRTSEVALAFLKINAIQIVVQGNNVYFHTRAVTGSIC